MIKTDSIASLVLLVSLVASTFGVLPETAHAQEKQTEAVEESGWIVVRPGDTLFSIARRHEVGVDELREWNQLPDTGIRAGMRLRVMPPIEEALQTDPDIAPEPSRVSFLGEGMVAVSLGPGETLFSLANRFALTPDSLSTLNPGLPGALESGMVIMVPQERVTRQRTVRRGDTLYSIARDEGTTVDQLRAVNDLAGSSLSVGQKLRIPASSVPTDGGLNLSEAGDFPIRPYPQAMSGRMLTSGQTFRSDAYQIGHPSLPAGSIVLVQTRDGRHAFAEVVERAPARRPVFIEGSRTLFETLSLEAGDRVSLFRVQ